MKFFIDTADVAEIKEAAKMGLLDGVTTNPSLVAKTGRPFREVLDEILAVVDGPVSAEVTATDCDGIRREAEALHEIHENIVVKIPIIPEGLKATKWCAENGIKTNLTLCFSPLQALLAAKAGATFVSPFVGRHDDNGFDGMQLIADIRLIYDNYAYETEILVASVRHGIHVLEAAKIGADVMTAPPSVIKGLFKHILTEKGIEGFLADWAKTGQSI